jgi:hypothetical protein
MSPTKRKWFTYLAISLIALGLWLRLGYSEFSFVDLSISKSQALVTAQKYLSDQRLNPKAYQQVIILTTDNDTDLYLQKTLGFKDELAFLKKHHFNLFQWVVRFFKEGEKEEHYITVDTASGKIVSYHHLIEETAAREDIPLEAGYEEAKNFLSQRFLINFDDYTPKEKTIKKYDHRTDFSFSWQKNDVSIPWSQKTNAGTAKLLIKATVSGKEIRSFDAHVLDIPDEFSRSIEKSKQSGRILTGLFLALYYILIMIATYLVVIKRQHLMMQLSKNFYICIAAILFALITISYLNNIPDILFGYATTSTLNVYFTELALGLLVFNAFLALVIILPGLAGESLAEETSHDRHGFSHYLQSTFLSRKVFSLITLGYFIAVIMFGLQSTLFYLGRTYFNVWTERLQMAQASSSFWPFLTILAMSFRAGVTEETFFRLFGISWGQKIFKNTFLACLVMSLIWGFGHTHYPVFPAWFRGFEVSCLGLLLSFFYLRYGIIPVIVAHYLFDAFWGSAGFLFGKSQPIDFIMCLVILCLPLMFALIAFIANKPDVKKKLCLALHKHQLYNLKILEGFLTNAENWKDKTPEDLRKDLLDHGWDGVVVDEALIRIKKQDCK